MSQGQLSEVGGLLCGAEGGGHSRQGSNGGRTPGGELQAWWGAHHAAPAVLGCRQEQRDGAGGNWRGRP